jgi:rhomboid protease GluP
MANAENAAQAAHADDARMGRSASQTQVTSPGFPFVTVTLAALIALGNLAQVISPPVVKALWRDPKALAAGEWWRLVTPIFVQADGLVAFIILFVALLLVGVTVERYYGHLRWLILFFAGGLVGEIAGYAWQPYDAGMSIAVFGLVGGLLVFTLRHPDIALRRERSNLLGALALILSVGLIASLAGGDAGNATISGALAAITAGVFVSLAQRVPNRRVVAVYAFAIGVIGAILMTVLRDLHGPALLAGLAAGGILAFIDSRVQATPAA